ncbi:MAG: hypothetical protein JST06_05210 [Bacteroidetes bacterium]|nr:hypothetical protein [Bacteroidota bacterium]MBS1629828.1 hypothetical protein [Bacteroidota bacterium]
MRNIFFLSLLCLLFLIFSCKKSVDSSNSPPPPPPRDSFQVLISGGYGSGVYKPGDTVHIFSAALDDSHIFQSWTGDASTLLNAPNEWHTWFLMPSRDVTFSANLSAISPVLLSYEQIQGSQRLKPVYYFFPAHPRGEVFLLHGTNGSAANVVQSFEWQQLIKQLVTEQFAVIVTESEESTTRTDLNNDGKIRWNALPWDSLSNPDFANINALTDTFQQRGFMATNMPRYAVGMSNGGNFAASLATMLHFTAAVSYCAPAGDLIAGRTTTPIQFCMARFDNNPNVGTVGNASAFQDAQTLTTRGICNRYLVKERAPLYPQRFARRGDISDTLSAAIFSEIKAHGLLDSRNYFQGYSETLDSAFSANRSGFPVLASLSTLQYFFVDQQISLSVSDHQMYSDYNSATLHFLEQPCP